MLIRMMTEVLLGLVLFALGANGAPQTNSFMLDGKIIGGQVVDIRDFPYQASMIYFGSHICGAVNIAPFFMLTAGHCVTAAVVSVTSVRVGSSLHSSGGLVISVERFYRHPQYDAGTLDYDIALMELKFGLGSGAGVSAIALPYQNQEIEAGTMSVVSGWGTVYEGAESIPDELQAVNIPIVDLDECRRVYTSREVTPRMLCAGVPQGGLDACQGDSGGPLVIEGPLLVGLVSWGLGCARPNYPGVNTNVAALRDFIKEIAKV